MTRKRRLTRVQWIKGDTSPQEAVLAKNDPALWEGLSTEDNSPSRGMLPVEEEQTEKLPCQQESIEATVFSGEETFNEAGEPYNSNLLTEEASEGEFSPEAGVLDEEQISAEEASEGEFSSEADALDEEQTPVEEQRHPLSNALLILVGLYIFCGVAPLFVALFVSLRVFFWLEIAGWIIILGWLVIGVRPPLLVWIKEKRQAPQEQAGEG